MTNVKPRGGICARTNHASFGACISRFVVAIALASLASVHCGGPGFTSVATTGPVASDAGDGAVVPIIIPRAPDNNDASACNTAMAPKDDPCVLDDRYGVFVAPPPSVADAAGTIGIDGSAATTADNIDAAFDASGGQLDDGLFDAADDAQSAADGTMAHPYTTITDALSHMGGKSSLFVCNGRYLEQVTITKAVNIYGGLSCAAGWQWVGGTAQVTVPSNATSGQPPYALIVSTPASTPVLIEDMAFATPDAVGQDASGNGASSIVAFVDGSTVNLTRCILSAGRGARGSNGETEPSNYVPLPAPGAPSYAPVGSQAPEDVGFTARGAGGTIICNYMADGVTPDSSTGGAGGDAEDDNGGAGLPGISVPLPTIVNTGASPPQDGAGAPANGAAGDPGADGMPRGPGAAATNAGSASSMGWIPSSGSSAPAGQPGQGGGGGGTRIGQCFSGGAGGSAGGCGGSGGTGGGGGGASIAILDLGGSVTLSACSLTTSQAGDGGNGGNGEEGQLGGPSTATTCGAIPGGAGGNGAGGSGGGGGSAGISVGVVYIPGSVVSSSPDTVINTGPPGAPGLGGQPGQSAGFAGASGNPGYLDGQANAPTLLVSYLP